MRTKEIAQLEKDLRRVNEERDAFVAKSRKEAAELTQKLETLRAEESVAAKVKGMSDTERTAMRKALGES